MSGFICDHEHEKHKDDNYMALYREEGNLFSVRVHYNGRFVANPILSYEGGKVETFDCCDVDSFELGSIESWAFRFRFRFLSLILKHKSMNVYFLGSSNSQLIDEVDDGALNLSLKHSGVSNELLKSKSIEPAKLTVIPFNLGDDNDVAQVNGIENEIENITELGNVNEIGKENVNEVWNETEKGKENVNEVENEDFGMDYDSADDVDYSEESESDDSGEDDELNHEDVLYGKEMDGFDDGDLPGSQPTSSTTFLENIEEEFVIPDHDGHGEANVDAPNDDSDSDDPTGAAAVNKKKGPQMSTFEESVFDGTLNEGQTLGNKKKMYGGHMIDMTLKTNRGG
ncbi:hypothetical protein LIER_14389 [Lithospermum erythrorhizon]|uniref:Uncharacterized protein n=1 Tax=Lithospermum erythrorhizon TaxID=34254 RepID=A0AAV3Q361_LITER